MMPPTGPLKGIRVLDVTQYVAGPFCSMLLGDLGAEVIKVEPPGRGDIYRVQGPHFIGTEATSFLSLNRNKKSLTLNLKDGRAKEIFGRLLARSDIFVENFKPGTLDRLGFDYQRVHASHPRLIYCSISGYGQTGPDRDLGGYDLMAQGRGGMMSVTGIADGPPVKAGVPIVDMGAAMYAVLGILAAYIERERDGEGQLVDVSLLDSAVSWGCMLFMEYLATGIVPGRLGSASPLFAPYQAFRAQDGYINVIGTGGKDHWERFCRVLGHEEWASDPRFSSNKERIAHLEELTRLIEGVMATAPVAIWLAKLRAEGLPCDPIQTMDQVMEDPQVRAREMVKTLDHGSVGTLHVTGTPVKMSGTPYGGFTAPPTLGQHSEEILTCLGYTPDEISSLREAGVI